MSKKFVSRWMILFLFLATMAFRSHAKEADVNAPEIASIWIEGETATDTNPFCGIVNCVGKNGASGGQFLRLEPGGWNVRQGPPPYFAVFKFEVKTEGTYNLWLSVSPQNATWTSPIEYSLDGAPIISLKGKKWAGKEYGATPFDKYFGWVLVEATNLKAGEHTLRLEVTTPRANDGKYMAFIDAILLTTDLKFVPEGNHPKYSTQPEWSELMKTTTEAQLGRDLKKKMYNLLIPYSQEAVGPDSAADVMKKIMARPLPTPESRAEGVTEFGLHGMEKPFVMAGRDAEKLEVVYELLARAGVDSFRTAESCWHRLAKAEDALQLRYTDLDYQVEHAQKYGMTHLFTVGYPPGKYTVHGQNKLSATKPQYYPQYRDYFRAVLERYKDKGLRYVELCNEVDAPSVWWRGGSTADMYVQEMRILKEEVSKVSPEVKTVAFGATYSRDEVLGGKDGGRRFVKKCMELGIDQYSDCYSIHHTAELKSKGFPEFFRSEMAAVGSANKPLLDTEQYGVGSAPYGGVFSFARGFFLYGMTRVDFFLAQDFYENGYLKPKALFDMDWNPKLRLLAYAFSVDAMKGRKLVGMARPAPGIEAYVLQYAEGYHGKGARYSIVLWKNERETASLPNTAEIAPVEVSGFFGVTSAVNWRLDSVTYDAANPKFMVGEAPLAVYASKLPKWKLISAAEFLGTIEGGGTAAPLPVGAQ